MLVTSVIRAAGGAVFFGKDPSGNRLRAVADGAHIGRPPSVPRPGDFGEPSRGIRSSAISCRLKTPTR